MATQVIMDNKKYQDRLSVILGYEHAKCTLMYCSKQGSMPPAQIWETHVSKAASGACLVVVCQAHDGSKTVGGGQHEQARTDGHLRGAGGCCEGT